MREKSLYWADNYIEKQQEAEKAIRIIKSGQRVFIGSACGEPQALVRALADHSKLFTGLEIVRMLSRETTPLTQIANDTRESNFSIRHIYLGSTNSDYFANNLRFVTPMNMVDVPRLFKSDRKSTRLNSSHSDRSRMPSSA